VPKQISQHLLLLSHNIMKQESRLWDEKTGWQALRPPLARPPQRNIACSESIGTPEVYTAFAAPECPASLARNAVQSFSVLLSPGQSSAKTVMTCEASTLQSGSDGC